MQDAFWGILIPFLGTSLGAGCVFFLKKSLSDGIQRALTGFAAGVMVAASVWSLLIPAMEQAADLGRLAFFPAAAGFWLGVLFLLLLDHLIPHLHQNSLQAEGPKSQLQRTTMMVLAVTLHNIPEGMAVGVVYAGYLAGTTQITAAGALVLSLGIAIQNFPEGAIISMPLRAEGMKKGRAFWGGVLSGIVEPIGAVLTILAAGIVVPALPLSAQLCCRSHAVCGGGGTDPGNVAGAALQRRHGVFCGGLQRDDGAGCGTGVTVGVPEKRNLFQNLRKCLNSLTEETAGRIILAEGPLRSGFL